MKQFNLTFHNKPNKSLSQRFFLRSARHKQKSIQKIKTNKTLHTQPVSIQPPSSQPKERGNTERTKPSSFYKANSNLNLTLNRNNKRQLGYKQIQSYKQENYQLKKELNRLVSTLDKQKSKNSYNNKIYAKINRQVELEYADEKYYEHDCHPRKLVEGVKYQYHLMKQKYEQKTKEYQQLLKKIQVSNSEQQRIYVQCLQAENVKLKDQLKGLATRSQAYFNDHKRKEQLIVYQSGQSMKLTKEWKDQQKAKIIELLDISVEMHQLKTQQTTHLVMIQSLKQSVQLQKQKIRQLNIKIKYLDSLLLQKSNKMHELVMKERRKSEQLKNTSFLFQKMSKRLQEQQQNHRLQVETLISQQNIKFTTEKNIFMKCLQQKDEIIAKLKKELEYLSTVIKYIGSGKQINKFETEKRSHQDPDRKGNQEHLLLKIQQSLASIQLTDGLNVSNRKRAKTILESGLKELSKQRKGIISNERELVEIQKTNSEIYQQEDTNLRQTIYESRAIKRSYLKHSENCARMKAIKPSQINHLKKQITYKLIHHDIQFDTIKEFLDLRPQLLSSLSKRQRIWKMQYISMSQLQQILTSYPFELKQEDAFLLARYAVQDHTNQIVYCSLDNQIQRTIAKSIIRAFIGQYLLPDKDQVRKQLQGIIEKYGKNMLSALGSLAPSGYLSDIKFLTICESIQVDFSQQAKNHVLSRLYWFSKDLERLQYKLFFSQFKN